MRIFIPLVVITLSVLNGVMGELDMVFHVPFEPSSDPGVGIPLSIPETIAVSWSEVLVSSSYSCISNTSVIAKYVGSFNGTNHSPAISYFSIDSRPDWTIGSDPIPGFVCVDGKRIGHFDYYSIPILDLPSGHPPFGKTTVNVRLFVNPGWMTELGRDRREQNDETLRFSGIACTGCDVNVHAVALKSPVAGQNACNGRREENNFLMKFFNEEDGGHIRNIFPFEMRLSDVAQDKGIVPFNVETDDSPPAPSRLHTYTLSSDKVSMFTIGGQEKGDSIFSKPVHWCFYSDVNADNGIYLGDVVFLLSHNDTAGLVIFILFFMVLFPIIVVVTTALYCYRLKRQRRWVMSVKYFIQRLQLESELRNRNRIRAGDQEMNVISGSSGV